MTQASQNQPAKPSEALRLIGQVQRRMRWVARSRVAYFWCLVLATVFALGLIVSRLTGYGAEWFNPWLGAAIPLLSLLGGFLL